MIKRAYHGNSDIYWHFNYSVSVDPFKIVLAAVFHFHLVDSSAHDMFLSSRMSVVISHQLQLQLSPRFVADDYFLISLCLLCFSFSISFSDVVGLHGHQAPPASHSAAVRGEWSRWALHFCQRHSQVLSVEMRGNFRAHYRAAAGPQRATVVGRSDIGSGRLHYSRCNRSGAELLQR